MPTIALAQLSMSRHVSDNIQKTVVAMESAAEKRADLIMFPEVQFCPFFPKHRNFDARQYLMAIDHDAVKKIRRECNRLNLIGAFNIYLAENGRAFDASVLVDKDGEILGVSKMIHITQAPDFYEQDYFSPTTDGFLVRTTAHGRVGVVICFDRHYPESVRNCTLQGADIILVPTVNMHGEPLEMFEWELRVAAFHNSVYIAMCNRVGKEDHVEYCGRSVLIDPRGDVVLRADSQEDVFFANYDLNLVRDVRKNNKYLELYRQENFSL